MSASASEVAVSDSALLFVLPVKALAYNLVSHVEAPYVLWVSKWQMKAKLQPIGDF